MPLEILVSRRDLSLTLLALIVLMSAMSVSAFADTFGIRNELLVDASAPCGPLAQGTIDTGLVQPSSPQTNSLTESSVGSFAGQTGSASATGSATSFYGSLRASGNGTATPIVHLCGAGARSLPFNGPNAFFMDQLSVNSSVLPHGTPVDLTFSLAFPEVLRTWT